MRAALLSTLAAAASIAAAASPAAPPSPAALACDVDARGAFVLSVNGAPYFTSAATYFRADGAAYSTADGTLAVAAPPGAPTSGSDAIGDFARVEVAWRAAGAPGEAFRTAVQVYAAAGAVFFEQSWPGGANGTAVPGAGAADAVLSAWPSFALGAAASMARTDESIAAAGPDAAVAFGGRFLEGSRAVAWADVARNGMASVGQHGGPLVAFDRALATSVAVLSLTQHTVSISAVDGTGAGAALSYGIIGSVTSIPAGFVSRTLVAATQGGPTAGMLRAGRLALAYHNTTRAPDVTTKTLGYATDNGAYFYYQTEKNASTGKPLTYEQTLLDVVADAKARGIPYRYMQLDSWWYTQGRGGGVVNWTAKAEVFPHGLAWFHERTGLPFYMHNRMWAAETVYAKQNGGGYDFIVEPANNLAIPDSQSFWDDLLFNASSEWGMIVYEQDWMYNEVEGLNATRESPTLAGTWLTQMATAAAKVGATVQFCMSLGRLVMMSSELPAITQFRAGDDYGPGQTQGCSFPYCVYYIGTTSLLGWSLDIAPSKDGFWSAELQPGSPFGRGNATEPYAAMEAAIAVYSTAPVQLDDGLGPDGVSFTNVTLALATCTSGGRLLQPSRPASATDASFLAAALGAGGPVAQRDGNLPVMSSHTRVAERLWTHVLVIGLAGAAELRPADLPLDVAPPAAAGDSSLLAYRGWSENGGGSFELLGAFSADAPLALAAAPDPHMWSLFHVAPVFSNGWAYVGEASKLVPVSVLRSASVAPTAAGVQVGIAGEPGELVTLSFITPGGAVVAASCTLPASGAATLTVDAGGGACAAVAPAPPTAAQARLRPPRGFNPCNGLQCDMSAAGFGETALRALADSIAANGMLAAGYSWFNLDDGIVSSRDAEGVLVADTAGFPSGTLRPLADYVNGLGLALGVYTDRGATTCEGRPGAQGHEAQDAATWVSWGARYVKSDSCASDQDYLAAASDYRKMREGLDATGEDVFFSLCAWFSGYAAFSTLSPRVADAWRIGTDVPNMPRFFQNIEAAAAASAFTGPGKGWPDVDMIGGRWSADEERLHVSFIAVIGGPLLLSWNVSAPGASTLPLSAYLNAELLDIHSDDAAPSVAARGLYYQRIAGGAVTGAASANNNLAALPIDTNVSPLLKSNPKSRAPLLSALTGPTSRACRCPVTRLARPLCGRRT